MRGVVRVLSFYFLFAQFLSPTFRAVCLFAIDNPHVDYVEYLGEQGEQ